MKIAFTGPESCGKSTLARWCAATINTSLSEEFARGYLEKNASYDVADLDKICLGQIEDWTNQKQSFVADTEMTVLKIWSEVRFQHVSEGIMEYYRKQHFDHYFLCAPDIPWEADPLRENPNDRDFLFELYKKELEQMKRPFTVLRGTLNERKQLCERVLVNLQNT